MYTSQARVEDYLKRSLTQHEVVLLPVLVEAAQSYIDGELDTSFDQIGAAVARYYDGDGSTELRIDPATEIESIAFTDIYGAVQQTLAAHEYITSPLNKNVKTSVRMKVQRLPRGTGNIKVIAKYSSYDGGIPKGIMLACTMLVADYLQSDEQNIKAEETEGWKVQYGSMPDLTSKVESLLAPFKRLAL